MSIGQSIKVRPLFGWSGSSCLWRAASTCNLRTTWYLSWRTRCRIATAIRRSDISKLCCNAVKLQPWRQSTSRLVPLGKAGLPTTNSIRHQTWSCLPILCILMFYVFPSLPVTASASCRVMLSVFFATSSNRFWNFTPSWTGTARGHGRKTGGKSHCRLLFWKLLSSWICWPGQPEVAAGVARQCLQTIAAGVARRLKKCDTWRACKDIDGLIGDTLIGWLTNGWLIDRLIDWLIYWEVDQHLTKWLIEWFIDWLFHEWLNALFAAFCNQVTYRSFLVVVISSSGPEAYMLFLILKWLSLFKISNTWMHLHRFDLDMLCEHNHEHSLVRELWPTRGPICLGRNSAAKPWCCWDTTAHTVSIGTPLGSPRSRSGHSSHNVLQLETRTNASQDGASTVMCVQEAGWEGMPNPVAVNENESGQSLPADPA